MYLVIISIFRLISFGFQNDGPHRDYEKFQIGGRREQEKLLPALSLRKSGGETARKIPLGPATFHDAGRVYVIAVLEKTSSG